MGSPLRMMAVAVGGMRAYGPAASEHDGGDQRQEGGGRGGGAMSGESLGGIAARAAA